MQVPLQFEWPEEMRFVKANVIGVRAKLQYTAWSSSKADHIGHTKLRFPRTDASLNLRRLFPAPPRSLRSVVKVGCCHTDRLLQDSASTRTYTNTR